MATVVVAIVVWPKKYRSEGKLFIRPSVQNAAIDPTVTNDQAISMNESRELEINSIVEILSSRAMAEQVVNAIGSETILGKSGNAAEVDSGESSRKKHEAAIRKLTRSLVIASPKESRIIDVSCDTQSAELAQQIVKSLMDCYLEEHVRINRTDGSLDFFRQQADLLKEKFRNATADLRDEKNRIGVGSIEGQRTILQGKIIQIESQLITIRNQVAATTAKVTHLAASIENLPDVMLTQEVSGLPNNAADQIKQEVALLRVRQQDLLSKYTEQHPLAISIANQVQELENILADQEPHRTQSTTATNPNRQKLELDLLTEQALLASLAASVSKLNEERGLALGQMKQLNFDEVHMLELQQQVELARANFRKYADKLEQGRIHHELETKRISNVKIVQAASLQSLPVSPRRTLMLAIGLIAASVGAYGVAMLFASQ
ncbi:MAG: hypothetical protein IH991_14295, partial [Planctomycetes bacterium]|nr:hypothetical protein [Planctomycetota bacterium]